MASPTDNRKSALGSLLQKLPRLSMSVWIIIILALFLVITVPMYFSYMDETTKQEALRANLAQLQAQYAALQGKLAAQANINAEIAALQAEIQTANLQYRDACDSIETSKKLLDLAWKWDITVINMNVTTSTATLLKATYPATAYSLNVNGQVAAFQNYLIEVGNVLPTAQITDVIIQPSQVEGGLDSAILTITVFCNK